MSALIIHFDTYSKIRLMVKWMKDFSNWLEQQLAKDLGKITRIVE